MNEKYNLSEIYNENFLKIIVPIFDITSLFTSVLSILLILVIITKTPKQMQTFKTFLLPYSIITFFLGLVFGFYGPILLHPIPCFYPIGYARFFSPQISWISFVLIFNLAMGLIDSCTAMSLERYFAIRNLSTSKIPFQIYCILIFIDFLTTATMLTVIFYQPIKDKLFITDQKLETFMNDRFSDYGIITPEHVLAFPNSVKNQFPYFIITIILAGNIHFAGALIMMFLNIRLSRSLQTMPSKKSDMLLRMTFIQFFGMLCFMGFSTICILCLFIFIQKPTNAGNYLITIINAYWLYDVLITIIFIRPYRNFFVLLIKKCFCGKWKSAVSPISRKSLTAAIN